MQPKSTPFLGVGNALGCRLNDNLYKGFDAND